MRKSLPVAVVISLLFLLPVPTLADKASSDTTPVEALEAALRAGRVDEAVNLLTDDAILRDLEGTEHSGKEAVRAALEGFMKDEWRADVGNRQVVEPGRVTWLASVSSAALKRLGVAPLEAAGEATIREGKVASYRLRLPAAAAIRYEKARTAAARDLVKSLLDLALVKGDEAGMRALLAADFKDNAFAFPGHKGDADGFLAAAAALRGAVSELSVGPVDQYVDGDYVTARFTVRGKWSGSFVNRQGDGRLVERGHVWLFGVAGGRVA